MKRGVFGMILLTGILLSGIFVADRAQTRAFSAAALLQEARQAEQAGELQKTAALTGRARAAWEDLHLFAGCLIHEDQIQEIDCLWDLMKKNADRGNTEAALGISLILEDRIRELGRDQQWSLQNFL